MYNSSTNIQVDHNVNFCQGMLNIEINLKRQEQFSNENKLNISRTKLVIILMLNVYTHPVHKHMSCECIRFLCSTH